MYGHTISYSFIPVSHRIYFVLVVYTLKLNWMALGREHVTIGLKVAIELPLEVSSMVGHNLVLGRPMLGSHPVQPTDAPYLMSKTPGRALANRGENMGALSVKGKNVPRTPARESSFFPSRLIREILTTLQCSA